MCLYIILSCNQVFPIRRTWSAFRYCGCYFQENHGVQEAVNECKPTVCSPPKTHSFPERRGRNKSYPVQCPRVHSDDTHYFVCHLLVKMHALKPKKKSVRSCFFKCKHILLKFQRKAKLLNSVKMFF